MKYVMFPDSNAAFRNRPDVPVAEVNYGQLDDIYFVELRDHGHADVPRRFLLARVTPCETYGRDATKRLVSYTCTLPQIIINLQVIEAAVGRIPRNG